MQILILGTGSAEGLPAIFCDCAVCTEARRRGGPDLRTRSSILINDTIKIDLPPDTLCHVHQYEHSFANLRDLLFTHAHDDHFAIRELQYLSPNFAPNRRRPLHIWASPDAISQLNRGIIGFFENAPLCREALTPFQETIIGDLAVTPITANHKDDEVCLNYLLRGKSEYSDDPCTLLYATDTGWYEAKTWDFLEKQTISAVIVECGKGISDNPYSGHLSVDDVRRFRARLVATGTLSPDAPFYVTHISHTGLLLHDEMTRLLQPDNIQVACDGLRLTL